MELNKQGKNVSFEIRDFELNKKGEKHVQYTDEVYLKQRRILKREWSLSNKYRTNYKTSF